MRKHALRLSVDELDRLSVPLALVASVGYWIAIIIVAYLKAV